MNKEEYVELIKKLREMIKSGSMQNVHVRNRNVNGTEVL